MILQEHIQTAKKKIGLALKDVRENIYIASKTFSQDIEGFWNDLETSLQNLQTDYLDLYQFHNPPSCPKPEDQIYQAMLEAKQQGLIKHIGISTHKYTIANEAIQSNLYETLQFPFSYLTGNKELEIVKKCKLQNIGFIAMKAMAGGLIQNTQASYAFMQKFNNVLPIWGIQKQTELNKFINCQKSNTQLNNQLIKEIKKDKKELQGNFCRGCGYCNPCNANIEISTCARMSLWIRRFPTQPCLTQETQEKMNKINDCTECLQCIKKCPYQLNIPKLLKENYKDYQNILSGKTKIE